MKHLVANGVVQYCYNKGDQIKWHDHKLTQPNQPPIPSFASIFLEDSQEDDRSDSVDYVETSLYLDFRAELFKTGLR